MTIQSRNAALSVVVLLLVGVAVATEAFAYRANGAFGFPLDDPWIHLQFARNLHDLGRFSYFQNDAVTSGSTSPLYTLSLALGFFATSHEMILSYALGVLCLGGAAVFFFLLAERWFGGTARELVPVAATVLFALEPRLQWAALSGMETTMFVLMLLAVVLFFLQERRILLGVAAGLLIWIRPEAIILFGALAADLWYRARVVRADDARAPVRSAAWLTPALGVAAAFGVAYVLFNLTLSGSILPNTYAAKVTFYATRNAAFPAQVFRFLTAGHLVVFAPFVAVGVLSTVARVVQRKPAPQLVSLLFTLGLFVAYWWKLPYLYQNGRYLMPALPFVIFLGVSGVELVLTRWRRAPGPGDPDMILMLGRPLLYAVFIVQFGRATWENRIFYQESAKYINDRQVRAGKWIHDQLPQDAVIGTHDVGAIAYYSGRKVVDMVGLVSPEAIGTIGDSDKLEAFLVAQHVTHLALLRNWFEAVNVDPIFQTDEQAPEIMEIFEFDPQRIHFTSSDVGGLTDLGGRLLAAGNGAAARPPLEEAVRRDAMSSRAHHHLGRAWLSAGKLDDAEKEFRAAIALHPSYRDAYTGLAQVALARGDSATANRYLEQLRERQGQLPK